MSNRISNHINHKLYLTKDSVIEYRSFENEMSFYDAVKNGDLETVEAEMIKFQQEALQGKGILSDNIVRNLLYHFIISTAMVARFCIEGGMDHEMAYSLSDYYIQKADRCTTTDSLKNLQFTMAMDYCKRMKQMKKVNIYSKNIVRVIDYIYDNLHQPLTIKGIAEHVGLSDTYLSKLFKKETGTSVSAYIRSRRIEAAQNMLKFSEYSYEEISSHLCFASQSHFTSVFKKETGCTPKVYRDRNFRKNFTLETNQKHLSNKK